MRGSFHLSRARRGEVAAMMLAPVGGGGHRRIAHRRAAPELAAEAVVGQPQPDRGEHQQADRREGEQRARQADERAARTRAPAPGR